GRAPRANNRSGLVNTTHSVTGSKWLTGLARVLEEHPAVAFWVRRRVEPAEGQVLRLAQDRRAGRASPLVVRVQVVHLDVHAVDHPGCGEPARGLIALLRVPPRAAVVRPGPTEHDRRAVELELRVGDAALVRAAALARVAE